MLECKTKIFWCPVPGFLLEFVLLNLLLTAFTLLFSFLQSVTSQVSPYSQGFFFRLDCHKSIQLCCKVLKFCFICIFFQEPLDLRRRSSGVLKVCLNSFKRLFLHTMRNIHDFLEIWVDKESWGELAQCQDWDQTDLFKLL